jgi:hypothetical protein
MIKKKFNALLVVVLLGIICMPATWAAFPVQKAKTEQTQGTTTSTTTIVSTNLEKKKSATEAKLMKKEAKKSLMQRFGGGGKSQLVALLLAIFVGCIGIHRFYLGYTWQGVVQLLTLGGCGIWAFIDLIRIITGDLEPKNGPYEETL